jgi:hypothetical protein
LGVGLVFHNRRRLSVRELDSTSLQPLAGTTVTLHGPDGSRLGARVEDIQIIRHPARAGAPANEQISLLLTPVSPEAPGGHYRLDTDTLEIGELDFTAVGRDGRERRLEAVITRIV